MADTTKSDNLVDLWRGYSSIDLCTSKVVNYFVKKGLLNDNTECVVTEKIHGANLSFNTNGKTVYVCKRSGKVELDENFFKHAELLNTYKTDILEIFNKVLVKYPNTVLVQIFGEVFGGSYPGYKSNCKTVQKGVFYHPDIQFLCFDIKTVTSEMSHYKDDKGQIQNCAWFLSWDEMIELLAQTSIRTVPLIKKDKYKNLLELSPIFVTTVPQMYDLPSIPDNFAEGLVVKTNCRHVALHSRPMFKLKNQEKFGEVWARSMPRAGSDTAYGSVPSRSQDHIDKILNYCTENRFNEIIGKEGIESPTEKIIGLFIADAFKDYVKDLKESIEGEETETINNLTEDSKKIKVAIRVRLNELGWLNKWFGELLTN